MKNNARYLDLELLLGNVNKVTLYVLPDVATEDNDFHFVLAAYIDGVFSIVDRGLELLGDPSLFRPGMRLDISVIANQLNIEVIGVITPIRWKLGATYKANFSTERGSIINKFRSGKKTDIYYGQTVLILAAPGGGKTYCCRQILDSFESNGAIVHRLLFGERRVDSLGPGTIDSDSSAPIGYQLNALYKVLLDALIDAYSGEDVVIGIDSLTRIIEVLTTVHKGTHLVAGGISSPVKLMVSNLIRMAGQYAEGSLTIAGTCLWASRNSTWQNIASEMKAAANVEIQPDIERGYNDFNREKLTKVYPTINVLGKELAF